MRGNELLQLKEPGLSGVVDSQNKPLSSTYAWLVSIIEASFPGDGEMDLNHARTSNRSAL